MHYKANRRIRRTAASNHWRTSVKLFWLRSEQMRRAFNRARAVHRELSVPQLKHNRETRSLLIGLNPSCCQ